MVRRPLHEGVDWNTRVWYNIDNEKSRPLHEGVDWNQLKYILNMYLVCRPLHEGVDWNFFTAVFIPWISMSPSSRGRGLKYINRNCKTVYKRVALFTRAWIEIKSSELLSPSPSVALFTRAWIEILIFFLYSYFISRRPLHEGVDWNLPCFCVNHSICVALFTRAWIEME